MDLPAQDERMLSAHLETCESCAKFHHQIQQVLMASEDVPLPDELQAPQPEALARAIMEHLPQPKPSPFAFLTKLFGGGKPKAPKEKPAASKGKKSKAEPEVETASRFPHRTPAPQQDMEPPREAQIAASQSQPRGSRREAGEDHSGTATRLKAIAKGFAEPLTQTDSREAQSTTRSLGEKFGMAGPTANADDQPLTLAESIRRKIAESQKTTGDVGAAAPQENFDAAQPPEAESAWSKPPNLPNRQQVNQPTGLPSSAKASGEMPSMPPQGAQTQEGSGGGPASVLGNWGRPAPIDPSTWSSGSGGAPPAAQSKAGSGGASWEPSAPPAGGAKSSSDTWGRGWGEGSPKGADGQDSEWGPPPKGGAWDEPADAPAFAPPIQTPPIKTPPITPPAFATPASAASDTTANTQAKDSGWAKGAAPGTSGGAGSTTPWPSGSQAQDSWMTPGSHGWGAGQSGGGAATPSTPPIQDSWSQPKAQQPPADSWGTPGSASPAGWGPAASQPVPDSWAKPPAQQGSTSASSPQQESSSWGAPVSGSAGAWQQPAAGTSGGGWSSNTQGASSAWSQPSQGTGGWPSASATPPQAPAPTPAPTPAPAAKEPAPEQKKSSHAYNVEAEQIETGTWRAFSPGESALGAKAPAAAPAPAIDEKDRWDVPIQERMKAANQANASLPPPQPPATPVAPVTPIGAAPQNEAQNRWDVPIQERMAQAGGSSPDAWAAPQGGAFGAQPQAPAPAAPASQSGIPKDSIMDRLSNVLSAGGAGSTAPEANRWDMPIQERAQADSAAPSQPAKPTDSRWDLPIQERAKSPELSPPPERWDRPIQERTQQLTPTQFSPESTPAWPEPATEAAPPQAPQPAPAGGWAAASSAPPTQSSWDLPVVEAQEQLHNVPQDKQDHAGTAAASPLPQIGAPGSKPVASPLSTPGAQPFAPPIAMPGAAQAAPPAQPFQPVKTQAMQQTGGDRGLFHLDDQAIDRIFTEHLGITESGAPGAPVASPSPAQPVIMKSMPNIPAPGAQPSAPAPAAAQPAAPQGWSAQASGLPQPSALGMPAQSGPAIPAPPVAASPPQPPAPGQAPKIVPVMSRSSSTASGGLPTSKPQPSAPWSPTAPTPFSAPPSPPPNGPQPHAPAPAPVPPSAPAPAAQAQAAPAQQDASSGLFNLDDRAMDDLFSRNLGVTEVAKPVGGQATAEPQPAMAAAPAAPAQAAQPKPQPAPFGGLPGGPAPIAAPQPLPAPKPIAPPPAIPAPNVMPVAPPAAAPAQPAPSAQGGGLFHVDDNLMDKIFADNLGIKESGSGQGAQPAAPAPQAPSPCAPSAQAATPTPFAQAPAAAASPFAPQAPQAAPAPFAPPTPAPTPFAPQTPAATPFAPQAPAAAPAPFGAPPQAAAPAPFGAPPQAPPPAASSFSTEMESFGGAPAGPKVNVAEAVKALSEAVSTPPQGGPPPKIEGLGRLDPKAEAASDGGSGRIASIGKFLLDQKDLEKIGKLTASDLSDTKMKILTLEAASEIQSLLQHIGGQQGVLGSIIIGHDGLLIANTMPGDIEADSIGIWGLAVYMNTETAIKKIGHDRVHQIVARTPRGYLVIADFGGGLLVTLSDGKDTDALIPLMRSITQVVSQ